MVRPPPPLVPNSYSARLTDPSPSSEQDRTIPEGAQSWGCQSGTTGLPWGTVSSENWNMPWA